MSTSDPTQVALHGLPDQRAAQSVSSSNVQPADLMDPLAIFRIANELFSELPSSPEGYRLPEEATGASSSPAPSIATVPAMPPEQSLPSDQHLPTLPASAGSANLAPFTAQYQAGPPAVPGIAAWASETLPPTLPFSFLTEVRPIFSDSPVHVANPYPQAASITSFRSSPTQPSVGLANPVPSQRIPTSDTGYERETKPVEPVYQAPFSAGIRPPFASGSELSFLSELRPLFSSPSETNHAPRHISSSTELPSDAPFNLDLSNDFLPRNELDSLIGNGALSFVEASRPLESGDQTASLLPADFDNDVPKKLDLTSFPFDAESIKRDFPILQERVNGRSLVWLDNAATTQKPQAVIDRLKYFYEHENSNVHRAAHELAARATDAYEGARDKVRRFLNATSSSEIIFVRGATEGINLIAKSWGHRFIQKDDEIVITWLEHHANIVPWQMLCSSTGAKLRVAPVDEHGQVLLDEYEKLLGPRTRLVSLTQVSNALGVVTPAQQMIEIAHRYGAKVLLDGAQSVSHMRVDVQELDCDFFVFSGHKVFGPTGIGVVYGKPEILESMPAWQGGGNMIQDVTFEKTVYHGPPQRFEAGTGNIADAVGLGAAIDYLDRVGMPNISRHEHDLLLHATQELVRIPGLRIIGTAPEKAGVLSFVLDGFRTEDVGAFLNKNGIAVRSGHHCAQPILRRFGYESTVRVSLALYNTHEDIERLVTAVWNLRLGQNTL